jgi:hypothetical protein
MYTRTRPGAVSEREECFPRIRWHQLIARHPTFRIEGVRVGIVRRIAVQSVRGTAKDGTFWEIISGDNHASTFYNARQDGGNSRNHTHGLVNTSSQVIAFAKCRASANVVRCLEVGADLVRKALQSVRCMYQEEEYCAQCRSTGDHTCAKVSINLQRQASKLTSAHRQ